MYGKLECSIITIMKTILEKIDKNQNNTDIIREAGRILKEGGLVAFPTETVYGLGADALNMRPRRYMPQKEDRLTTL